MNSVKLFSILAASSVCLFISGCIGSANTPLQPHPQQQQLYQQLYPQYNPHQFAQQHYITSTPDGAAILINGSYVGKTPMFGLTGRRGDSVTIYKPGYDTANFQVQNEGPLNANVPIFHTDSRYYSLMVNSGANFSYRIDSVYLEPTNARAYPGANFVIYDHSIGSDIHLNVIEANRFYVRMRASDGKEFCYPVGQMNSSGIMSANQRNEYSRIGSIPQNPQQANTPYLQKNTQQTHSYPNANIQSGISSEYNSAHMF